MYMEARCGAWQVGEDADQGKVEFRVLFPAGFDPHVTAIQVVGDFQDQLGGANWSPSNGLALAIEAGGDPRGTFWSGVTGAALAAGFYEYKLRVTFDTGEVRLVTDPCARYSGLRNQNSGFVVGGSTAAENQVRPLAGGRRPLAELTVYELMIDDFTADYRGIRAPLEAVGDRLDDLRAAGFNAILFMPWTAWASQSFDWGYAPRGFFAVESRYANDLERPAEKLSWLKGLISQCHDRGIHVVMDGVFNHVAQDFPYSRLYRDAGDSPFTDKPFGGSFTGLLDLDFANACTGELIDDACRYWADVFGIDGIRFDNTVNYYVDHSLNGLPSILANIAGHVASKGESNFSLTLEHIDISAAAVVSSTDATSFWDNSLHEITFDGLWNGGMSTRLLNALNNRRFLPEGKVPTLYLSNHDHSHVTWQSGARTNRGAIGTWWRIQPYLIAMFTSTAVPLVPNGQEFGEEYFIPENDENTGRRVTPRPLRWKIRADKVGRALLALHSRLATMRQEHPALRSGLMYPDSWDESQTSLDPVGVGVDVDRQLAVFHRWAPAGGGVENVVVVLNLSDSDQAVEVPFPFGGHWDDLLAGFDGGPGWSLDVSGFSASVPVGSHFGRVLRSWRAAQD